MLKWEAAHNVLNAKCTNKKHKLWRRKENLDGNHCNQHGWSVPILNYLEVKAAGGLAIVGTERHDSSLTASCVVAGRQGDPEVLSFMYLLKTT
jgi:preprotein translocase subunit SecA